MPGEDLSLDHVPEQFGAPHDLSVADVPDLMEGADVSPDVGPSGLRARVVDAVLVGEDHRLDPVPEVELEQDALDVGPDRGLLDDEGVGDLPVGEPSGQEAENLAFSGGQARQGAGRPQVRDRLLGHAVDDASSDRGRQQRLAARRRVDCGDQLLRPGAFEQEAGRAGPERPEDVVVELEGGQDQDAYVGVVR